MVDPRGERESRDGTGKTGMEPLLRDVLLAEPEIAAWLEPPENEDADDEPAGAAY